MIDTNHKTTISKQYQIYFCKRNWSTYRNLVELTLEPAAVDNGIKFIRVDKKMIM